MPRRVGIAASLVALTVLPAGAIGNSFPGGPKPTSERVVIAEGEFRGQPLRISAWDSTYGLCLHYLEPDGAGGNCGPDALPPEGRAISIDLIGQGSSKPGAGVSEVAGKLRPDVAGVQVYFGRAGKRRTATTIWGQLTADQAALIHQPQFGSFMAVAHGCVTGRRFKAIALAADGAVLGVAKGFRTAGACQPPRSGDKGGGTTVIIPPYRAGAG